MHPIKTSHGTAILIVILLLAIIFIRYKTKQLEIATQDYLEQGIVDVTINSMPIKSPGNIQKLIELDEQRVQDLIVIQSKILSYWSKNFKLPESIEEAGATDILYSDIPIPLDPNTNKPYEYRKKTDSSYELCATFSLSTTEINKSKNIPTGTFVSGEFSWEHAAGKVCFKKSVNPGLVLISSTFKDGGSIPEKYTCDGNYLNPSISVKGVNFSAKSLVISMDDPDAPNGIFHHWTKIIPSAPFEGEIISEGQIIQGGASLDQLSYIAPCPPKGSAHRYIFTLYVIDIPASSLMQNLKPEENTKIGIEKRLSGHIIQKAELVGLYKRK